MFLKVRSLIGWLLTLTRLALALSASHPEFLRTLISYFRIFIQRMHN